MPYSGLPIEVSSVVVNKRKPLDEVVNNSDVLQDDNDLSFFVDVKEVWIFDLFVIYNDSSGGLADFKFSVVGPSGSTVKWVPIFTNFASVTFLGAVENGGSSYSANGSIGGTTDGAVVIKGTIVNGNVAGNLKLQWAQDTINASDLKVRANSWLRAIKI